MVGLLLISAAVIGVLTHATAAAAAGDLTPAKYDEYKQNLYKLTECLERERTPSAFSVASANRNEVQKNLNQKTCGTTEWSLWPRPKIDMCYHLENKKLGEFGDKYTFADETDVVGKRGAWFTAAKDFSHCAKRNHCDAGFAAKFQTKFNVVPRVVAHASIDSYLTPHKGQMKLELDIDTTVTTGISVMAAGSCSYTETKYFPRTPSPVARFCYGPACVVVFFQGMMELNIEGRLEAKATAVHQVTFGASGKFEVDTDSDMIEKNSFTIKTPKSAYRTRSYFHAHGKVSLKLGPVFTLMFTPGVGSLWASAIPWVQLEASMYGTTGLKEERGSDPDMEPISDAVFEAHTVKDLGKCTTPTEVVDATAPCFSAAVSLRTGVEVEVGFLPKSLGSNHAEVKQAIKNSVCKGGKRAKGKVGIAMDRKSVFEDGFARLMESPTTGRRLSKASVSQCIMDNTPATKRRLREGRASLSSAMQFWCGSMVDWLFFAIPEKSLYTAKLHGSCHDVFRTSPSNSCSNKVGCGAEVVPGAVLTRGEGGQEVKPGKPFIPEVRHDGRYYPICGHYFWDDKQGATSFCQSLGFKFGEVQKQRDVYSTDAMPVGKCKEGESVDKCSAGGNAFGNPGGLSCAKGEKVGVRVICSNLPPLVRPRGHPTVPAAGEPFVPEVYHNGKYHPICGHHFWDNNRGAESVCKRLGFDGGWVQKTHDVYSTDAMPVGKCNAGESVDKCSAGGNAFGDFSKEYCWMFCWFGEDNCRKGQKVGAKVVCTAKARN